MVAELEVEAVALCYHRAIALCFARGFTRFEAGAQGYHKLARGLLPAITHSAHLVGDPRLARAVRAFCEREAVAVAAEMEALAARGPYRRDR